LQADERFSTTVHPLLEVDGEIVSSSHIRGLVLAGDLAEASRLLGARFQLCGEVTHGDERGRERGAQQRPHGRPPNPTHLDECDVTVHLAFSRQQRSGSGAWARSELGMRRPTICATIALMYSLPVS